MCLRALVVGCTIDETIFGCPASIGPPQIAGFSYTKVQDVVISTWDVVISTTAEEMRTERERLSLSGDNRTTLASALATKDSSLYMPYATIGISPPCRNNDTLVLD